MDKSTLILEKAMLRLAEAEKKSRDRQCKMDAAHLIAHKIVENDVYFFLDPELDLLVIASLKNVQTIR